MKNFERNKIMGKTTKLDYPSSSVSSLTVNGLPITTTSTDGTTISADYYFSPTQTAINDYVEASLLNSLPNINTLSSGSTSNIDKQIQAYLNNGAETINDTYTPMIRSLENDVAKRFGNLDNSVFMDNINNLESSRAKAINALAQDVESKRNDIVDDALSNQYDYLNFLTDYQNQVYNNMLNTLQLSQSTLSLNSDYLSQLYDSLASKNNTNSKNDYSSLSKILSSLSNSVDF